MAAGEASHVQIFGQDYPTPDGTCIRDFVHVRDLADAHLLALEATGEGDPSLEVYNLGSAAGFSVREVVEAARKVTGRADPGPRRSSGACGDPPVLVASSRRARGASWAGSPQHSKLDEMLTDAWAWRMAHPDGYLAARPHRRAADRPEREAAGAESTDAPTAGETPAGAVACAASEQASLSCARRPRHARAQRP